MALPVGLGCAPIYPGIIHATPSHFGADRSQAIIGVQMCIRRKLSDAAAVSAQRDGSGCGSALWETACKRRCFNKIRIWEEK